MCESKFQNSISIHESFFKTPLYGIMATINMHGRRSFLLNDIKREIRNGRTVTHILNIKISNQPNAETGNRIRQRIFQIIKGKPITKDIHGLSVAVTWQTSATSRSAYYFSNNAFIDTFVKRHTKKLLTDVISQIDEEFGRIFSTGRTGLAFICTKPLVREVVLDDDDDETEQDE